MNKGLTGLTGIHLMTPSSADRVCHCYRANLTVPCSRCLFVSLSLLEIRSFVHLELIKYVKYVCHGSGKYRIQKLANSEFMFPSHSKDILAAQSFTQDGFPVV